MKFHLERTEGRNLITGYGPGYVAVNGAPHRSSVVILPDRVLPWDVSGPDELTHEAFAWLARLPVEILLLGTGASQRFPGVGLAQPVWTAGIGLEVMGTPAACRTYNILLAEHRRVGAALLIGC